MRKTKFTELLDSKIYFQVILTLDVFYTDFCPDDKPVREDYDSRAEFQEDMKTYRASIKQTKDTLLSNMPHTIAGKQRDAAILNFRETESDENDTDWGGGMSAIHRKWVFDIEAKDFYRLMIDGDWSKPVSTCDTMGSLTERGLMFAMSLDYEIGYGGNIMANAYVTPLIPEHFWWGGGMFDEMHTAFKERDWDYFKCLAKSVEDSALTDAFALKEPEVFGYWKGNPALEKYFGDIKEAADESEFEGRDLEAELQEACSKFYTRLTQPTLFEPCE